MNVTQGPISRLPNGTSALSVIAEIHPNIISIRRHSFVNSFDYDFLKP